MFGREIEWRCCCLTGTKMNKAFERMQKMSMEAIRFFFNKARIFSVFSGWFLMKWRGLHLKVRIGANKYGIV